MNPFNVLLGGRIRIFLRKIENRIFRSAGKFCCENATMAVKRHKEEDAKFGLLSLLRKEIVVHVYLLLFIVIVFYIIFDFCIFISLFYS